MTKENLTPMMKQYLSIKEEYKDSILFFRLGDFYEMFFEDAIIASKELEIALTKRSTGANSKSPMCGIPYHVANTYISKLISKGYKVAICDQLEDPALAKGIVKRDVTKVVTPGTLADFDYLKQDENNYLLSMIVKSHMVYLSYTDYSTGELYTTSKAYFEIDEAIDFIADELYRINPPEILINEISNDKINNFLNLSNFYINRIKEEELENIVFNSEEKSLINEIVFENIEKIEKENKLSDLSSIYILLKYLIKTQKHSLNHLNTIIYYERNKFLILDENSKKNLELVKGLNTNTKSGSLLEILDKTKTSMGSRELKKWVEAPLNNKDEIEYRLNLIEEFNSNLILLDDITNILKDIYDIERLSVKISNKNINPKEIVSLKNSLYEINNIKTLLENSNNNLFKELSSSINPLVEIQKEIDNIIVEDPPVTTDDSRFIKIGFSEELDELFEASEKGKNWLLNLENSEKEKTGIKNLKIKYNKILGFFIEVTKANLSMVPDNYIRKQTLVGSERYFTMELKEMESKILGSKDEAFKLQLTIFNKLKDFLVDNIFNIQKTAKNIAKIDSIISLAQVSRNNNYTRPNINDSGIIDIKNGRHPIVEAKFTGELFVPNNTFLNNSDEMIHIITGPNMAGKSTYMRQVALITIMMHIGCFVPADSANISIIDRIFTRIGASDNLAKGESTFMVEMKEVSNIVSNATKNSLLILDEVGRGTSTYDGLSIAWAIVEYIAKNIKAKTLFATHYHELVILSEKFDNIKNLTIEVEKTEDSIIFLRKIIEGFTNNSYGIEVAKLAGINDEIIRRASQILSVVENKENSNFKEKINDNSLVDIQQKSIFDVKKDEYINKVANININSISPIDALNLLNELVKESRDI